jgi:hypothetical protein
MPRVVATRVVAIYRPDDGRVVHMHTVRVFEGGRDVGREEAEEAARAHAARIGHDLSALAVHHHEGEELPGHFGAYSVDAASGRLVGRELPEGAKRNDRRRPRRSRP